MGLPWFPRNLQEKERRCCPRQETTRVQPHDHRPQVFRFVRQKALECRSVRVSPVRPQPSRIEAACSRLRLPLLGLPGGPPLRHLLFCECGCRLRFLDRTLVSGAHLLYLEDLDPLTIACVGGRLSMRSASDEHRKQTNKRGSDSGDVPQWKDAAMWTLRSAAHYALHRRRSIPLSSLSPLLC